jgi:hypothetical protein
VGNWSTGKTGPVEATLTHFCKSFSAAGGGAGQQARLVEKAGEKRDQSRQRRDLRRRLKEPVYREKRFNDAANRARRARVLVS